MFWMDWFKKKAKEEGVELEGLPGPPPSFSEADVTKRVEDALKTERDRMTAEFAEAQKKKDDDLKRREDALTAKERQTAKDGITAFCENLLKEGKLTPAVMKFGMGMENFLQQIAGIETTVEFGEGTEKKKQTPLEFIQELLSGLSKQIEFKEAASAGKDIPRSGSGKAGEKIEALIQEKMKADPKLAYTAAFAEVQTENTELAEEYLADLRV